MSQAFWVVLKRSYWKLIKSKAFWATTLVMPIFIAVVSIVSGISGQTMEDKIKEQSANAKAIYILDENNYIPKQFYAGNLIQTDNYEFGLEQVSTGKADAFIQYSKDLLESKTIKVFSQDKGIMSLGSFDEFSKTLLKQGIISSIQDPAKITLFSTEFKIESQLYKDGAKTSSGIEKLIIPIGSVIIYFLFTSLSTGYLLMSVSEEKENRMIEIILSSIKPKDLILGKILGQVAAVLTQIIVLLVVGVALMSTQNISLPFNPALIEINPGQIILAIIYLVLGFILLATAMVGVGAAMPTYREASSFASIFIIMSIFPIYFFPIILVDPSGLISNIVSYFPFTAPMILMLRNSLGAITPIEIVISFASLLIFMYLFAQLAYKLFEYGSLEYSQKISFKSFLKSLRKKDNKLKK
jgi:ABC-2 type transport system permease protein